MSSTPTTPVKGLPVTGVATSAPQVVSVPVGLQQQLLQQQGAQIVSAAAAAAAGQNIAYNVMQPMQTVTVDGQEALFIPAMSLAAGCSLSVLFLKNYTRFYISTYLPIIVTVFFI